MKKLFIFIPALLLVGCSGAKNVDFKSLKFEKPLNDEQLEEFNKNFNETVKNANGFKLSSIFEEKHGYVNEKQTSENTGFSRCKHSVLDYMSLKNPTKDQIKRLVDRIEIDKDKKVYVHLRFPELLEHV